MPARKWGSEKIVNTTVAGQQTGAEVAALAGGGYVVVWQDDGAAPSAVRAQRFDAAGNKLGPEITIASALPDAHTNPSVAGLADGGFYVTFTRDRGSNNDLEGEVYDANGNFVRAQTVALTVGKDDDTDAAADGTGSVVIWRDPNGDFDLVNDPTKSSDILIRRFDTAGAGGAIATANFVNLSATGDQNDFDPAVVTSSFGTVVAWRWTPLGAQGDIRATVYNASGTVTLSEFAVSTTNLDVQEAPTVTWLQGGAFVVAWMDSSQSMPGSGLDIRCRIFNQFGTALTPEILVNGNLTGAHLNPSIVALFSGGFAVAYTDTGGAGGDTSGTAIKLQVFDGAGAKVGGEILVNTTVAGNQTLVSLAALADGRIAAAWKDASVDGGDIRTQIIDPRDGLVNGTLGIDTLYGHDIVNDEVNGLDGDDVLRGLGGADQLFGGGDHDAIYGGKGGDFLFGGTGNDVLTGDLGDDELFGEDGVDDMRGGSGADAFDGGSGIDLANYSAAAASVTVALDGSLAGTGDASGDTFVNVEDVRGANVAGAGDTIRGNSGGNSLSGFNGNDNLNGRAGNDKLTGGLGTDTLTGELGNDQFLYSATSEGGDTITDFSSNAAGNNDLFRFKGTAFGGLPTGAILANQFQSSTGAAAANTDIRFFYETDTRILRFDADGSGLGAAVIIATLQVGATVVIDDISIF